MEPVPLLPVVSGSAHAVILAGGSGTRLWPLSRQGLPKQFLNLADGRTLLERTIDRVRPLFEPEEIWVVTSEEHAQGHAYHLLRPYRTLLEPEGRNTAPAIALAAARLLEEQPDPLMVVLPSDHLVRDVSRFRELLCQAIELADEGKLVTLGITPTRPETGFGYLQTAPEFPFEQPAPVKRFIEKPQQEVAARLLEEGRCYWNAGIFVWKAQEILSRIAQQLPDAYEVIEAMRERWRAGEGERDTTRKLFPRMPNVSIDHGVLEKTDGLWVIPGDIGWSDLGSWDTIHEVATKDIDNNVCSGSVLALDCGDSLLHSEGRLVAAVGVEGLCVVETTDAVLVTRLGQSQRVREVVDRLQQQQSPEHRLHTLVKRPWGSYTVLEDASGYKIKKIKVSPGCSLSLQSHQHRSEHWVVVSGTATVVCGDKVITVAKNESTYIPIGERHRLENRGKIPLRLIEVQVGDYLGEDDIQRYEDEYGRG